jgi:hypothetical protein
MQDSCTTAFSQMLIFLISPVSRQHTLFRPCQSRLEDGVTTGNGQQPRRFGDDDDDQMNLAQVSSLKS